MKTMQKFFLSMLVVIMGSLSVTSCGSDDDDNLLNVGNYTVGMTISDKGTMPDELYEATNLALSKMTETLENTTEIAAKAAYEISWGAVTISGLDMDYDYTLEYYLKNSKGNTVAAHYIFIKNGAVSKK